MCTELQYSAYRGVTLDPHWCLQALEVIHAYNSKETDIQLYDHVHFLKINLSRQVLLYGMNT